MTCQSRGHGHGRRGHEGSLSLLEAQEDGSLCVIGQSSRAYQLPTVGIVPGMPWRTLDAKIDDSKSQAEGSFPRRT